MKTDTLFYRLFLQRPQLIFDLADFPAYQKAPYRFQSVELKQAAFRIDGVFMPLAEQRECPLIFAEVQYQKDPKIYARLLSEILLYLYQNTPLHDWRAVVIFPDLASDPGKPAHYREFFDSGRIQVVYLDRLPQHGEGLGVQLIHLIEIDDARIPQQLARIKTAITASPQESRRDWLELLETLLVYKLPRLSRDEVRAMLSDILNVELKQTRFYQDVFAEGQQEGRQEGRQEGERLLLGRMLVKRFGALPGWAQQRLQDASTLQLERWSERILDAATLAAVFEDQ